MISNQKQEKNPYHQYINYCNSVKTNKLLVKDFFAFIEKKFPEILEHFLIKNLEKNIILEQEKDKLDKEFSFLLSDHEITRHLSQFSSLNNLENQIIYRLSILSKNIYSIDEIESSKLRIFKEKILLPGFYGEIKNYYYYYNNNNVNLYKAYRIIYSKQLLPKLEKIYFSSNIQQRIMNRNFQVCSRNDFKSENAFQTISFHNIGEFLKNYFFDDSKNIKKILTDQNVILLYKINILRKGLTLYEKKNQDFNHQELRDIKVNVLEKEEKIRKSIYNLLKGSLKQTSYFGFFTKEDYINWIHNKYSELPRERIESIFDSVVNPNPPIGVTKFHIPSKDNKDEITYFISIKNVSKIFMDLQNKIDNLDIISNDNIWYFILFLKRLLKEFKLKGLSNKKAAKKLECSEEMLITMKEFVDKGWKLKIESDLNKGL